MLNYAPSNHCFRIVVLQETLESPLDSKEIKPVNPKGNQPWSLLEGLMLKLQYFGQLIRRADSLEIDPDAGKNWGWEKRAAEDEMPGWHHQLNGHEFEQTPGKGERQGSLKCCSPRGHRGGYNLAIEQQQSLFPGVNNHCWTSHRMD